MAIFEIRNRCRGQGLLNCFEQMSFRPLVFPDCLFMFWDFTFSLSSFGESDSLQFNYFEVIIHRGVLSPEDISFVAEEKEGEDESITSQERAVIGSSSSECHCFLHFYFFELISDALFSIFQSS